MSDEARRHPPSERKLARLRAAGSTPASPALVGAAVLVSAWLLLVVGGPAVGGWLGAWVREALRAAAEPAANAEAAPSVARALAFRGALVIAGASVLVLTSALLVQAAQSGPRSEAAPATVSAREGAGAPRADAWSRGRPLLLCALAAVVIGCTVRAALLGADGLLDTSRPLDAAWAMARSVGWPLVTVLVAVALLDALAGRAAWMSGAWMTRREVEEELRDTQGPPLTRQRRGAAARRRRDA